MKRMFLLLLILSVFSSCDQQQFVPGKPPESGNVILVIGDGMGFAHIRAASLFDNGSEDGFSFQQYRIHTSVRTNSSSWFTSTDSAAAATAIATGISVLNGRISQTSLGQALETLLEYYKRYGKRTGLVTTTYMTHATPAAFGAHTSSRSNYEEIADDYLTQSKPNVLLGGGANGITKDEAQDVGYTVVTDETELMSIDTGSVEFLSGQFGTTHLPYELDGYGESPTLTEMVEKAVGILEQDPEGFFLMVEGGRIDHASHANDIQRMIAEAIALSEAIDWLDRWASGRGDTLIVVTADHETGKLNETIPITQGVLPPQADSYWGSTGHTSRLVPLYAWGYGAEGFELEVIDNEQIHDIILENF